ncbi:hypothetical protein [Cyclobacterium xiamenense]|uniref:hypothetical protein n=1 Tax=Cyclobacterium xiamenense TaxID=1297121 RepID=UPI0035D09CC2
MRTTRTTSSRILLAFGAMAAWIACESPNKEKAPVDPFAVRTDELTIKVDTLYDGFEHPGE